MSHSKENYHVKRTNQFHTVYQGRLNDSSFTKVSLNMKESRLSKISCESNYS